MFGLWRGRLAMKYIFFELLPVFVLGAVVFLFIILMFQSIRLTEYVIVHGASLFTIGKILLYMAIGLLPVILPMSLLFAILLTYGRMSADSEIVAFKALGLGFTQISFPGIVLSILVSLVSAQASFYFAPWGTNQMEELVNKLAQARPGASIREGVFSEGFFDLVVYANKVDSASGYLTKVFIYDERNQRSPLTIIAKRGQLVQEDIGNGWRAFLRLFDGNIHRTNEDAYTRISFTTYDINLFDPYGTEDKEKSPGAFTQQELKLEMQKRNMKEKRRRKLQIEYYRRGAVAFACILFGMVGIGLGTVTNKRHAKGSGFAICLVVIIAYWLSYGAFESLAKNNVIPLVLCVWMTNIVLAIIGIYSMHRAARQ